MEEASMPKLFRERPPRVSLVFGAPPPPPPLTKRNNEMIAEQIDLDVILQEKEEAFDDLFGERKKTVRSLLEEAFDEEMKKKTEERTNAVPPPPNVPTVPIRFRTPPVAAPAHDVFGDAVQYAFQHLMSRGAPPEFCHWFAYFYATEIDKELGGIYKNKPFKEEVYEMEGTLNAKKHFNEGVWPFVKKLLLKTKQQEKVLNEKWTGIFVSADQAKGRRQKQEDRFVAYPNGQYINHGKDSIALLAVFDGHGGSECSHYAAAHFWEEWLIARKMLGDYIESSLTSALASLDDRMTKRSIKEHWKGGTTAVCCAVDIENGEMAFAWLGDSSGYVMSSIEVRKVTSEHSPSDPNEARRVENAGGQIFLIGGEPRVNGVLNLTRALGDVNGRPMISNVADSLKLKIDADDYLVILVCDGVSDVFTPSDLYLLVEKFVQKHRSEDYATMADFICQEACEAGTSDNVTVVIGFLRHPTTLWKLFAGVATDEEDNDDYEVETGSEENGEEEVENRPI